MDDMTGVFKTAAFGGFNKDDVLNFIEMQKKIEADLRASVTALDTQLRELTQQYQTLVAAKNAAEEELKENRDAREAAAALSIKEAEYQALAQKYQQLSAQSDGAAEENRRLREHIAELEKALSDAQQPHEQPEPKAEPAGESLEARVGSAFVDARRFADQIVEEAKKSASAVNEQTRSCITSADKKAQLLSAELNLCMEKCMDMFRGIDADVQRLKNAMKNFSDEIG